jgi:primosomal protein N''
MMRELFDRANVKLRENLTEAAATLVKIINNPEYDPKLRADAAKWLIERTMGKTPEVTVNVDEKRIDKLFERLERNASTIEAEVVIEGYEP